MSSDNTAVEHDTTMQDLLTSFSERRETLHGMWYVASVVLGLVWRVGISLASCLM